MYRRRVSGKWRENLLGGKPTNRQKEKKTKIIQPTKQTNEPTTDGRERERDSVGHDFLIGNNNDCALRCTMYFMYVYVGRTILILISVYVLFYCCANRCILCCARDDRKRRKLMCEKKKKKKK